MKLDYIVISQIGNVSYAPTGPFINYLKYKKRRFLTILHPFNDICKDPTLVKLYTRKKLILKTFYLKIIKSFGLQFLSYFFEFFFNILYIIKNKLNSYRFVGMDCLAVLGGIILRRMGYVDIVIYYNVDFSRKRFKNLLINKLYIFLDDFVALHSDYVWNVSMRTCKERIKRGVRKENVIHMPNGVHIDNIKINKKSKNRYSLVYTGHIQKEKGLENLINAFPRILKKEKKATIIIIGEGEDLFFLKNLVTTLRLNNNVFFLGKKNNQEVLNILCKQGIGLALYDLSRDYTYYCDPVKVKEYLGCGCPVIISGIPEIGNILKKKKLGLIVKNPDDIINAYEFLLDNTNYEIYSKGAREFAFEFDWFKMYDKILIK